MPGVAYAIMCHHSARNVRDQFELLFSPDAWFFYHVDRKAPGELKELVEQMSFIHDNVKVISSVFCSWGGFSLTSVMIRLARAALQRRPWDHLVFLSEQHLPLQDYRAISAALLQDQNYIEHLPFRSLSKDGQNDVRSRFVRKYVELTGVGGFATELSEPSESFFDGLYHGSQWMTLCRSTCERIPEPEADYFRPFRNAVLSDETALQTWICHGSGEPAWNVNRTLTFVADPSRGGTADVIFDDRTFRTALDTGYLFIRKRPAVLSQMVSGWYADRMPLSRPLSALAGEGAEAVGDDPKGAGLVSGLIAKHLDQTAADGIELKSMPPDVIGPRFFYQIRHAGLRYPFHLYLLSQDLRDFKVAAVLHDRFRDFEESEVSGYRASVVRMRAHDLSFYREIHIGADHNDGFCSVSCVEDLATLIKVMAVFVDRLRVLAAHHPDSDV